jgi:hypothetical protein
LGFLFQIYPKGLPDIGDCYRFEGRYSSDKKESVVDTLANIANDKPPFVTAEDMLSSNRKKTE